MAAAARVLAVPPLGQPGGGTGLVGRLLWEVIRERWPEQSSLVALSGEGEAPPSLGRKIEFGAALARAQMNDARWVLFGHLGLARAQRLLLPRMRAPYAMFLHGVEAWASLSGGDRRRVGEARLRIANSRFTARRVAQANPDLGPIAVCPLALLPDVSDARVVPAPARQVPRVLIVGRLAADEAYKGHDQLIDAWPEVTACVPDAELVIVGAGDDEPRLRAKAEQMAGRRGITFMGFVDRETLDTLYAEAAVFAMPSRGEGFGLVYLEAMAHQLPCIGSIHDAAGEVIDHGTTGLLVDLEDRESLGRAVVQLLRDPGLRRRMGQAGRERLERQFSFERFSRDLLALLESHLERAA